MVDEYTFLFSAIVYLLRYFCYLVNWKLRKVTSGKWTRFLNLFSKGKQPTSAAILLLAYSIRMGPRSEDSRKEPWSAAMTCAAQRTSWYSMKATGDPPLLCMRRRQKPGKLCNKNTTSAAQCQGTTANYGMCEGTHSDCALNRTKPSPC